MEIYTINKTTNRREAIIEHFESFIWTERYSEYGDFQMVVEPKIDHINRLQTGIFLGFDQSNRVMVIDTVEKVEDDEGRLSLKIEGKSMEAIFEQRVAKNTFVDTDWIITGTPGSIISQMVTAICINGTGISPYDVFDISIINLSTDTNQYSIAVKTGTLYERIKEISDLFGLGFRIVHTQGVGQTFEIYEGSDLAYQNGVIFSEEYDNLANNSFLVSDRNYKNVAYVRAKNGNVIVGVNGTVNPTISGLDRRVIFIDATDIDEPAGQTLTNLLIDRGREELSKYNKSALFDGVIDPQGIFKYNIDYSLGDIVLFKGDGQEMQNMRVIEYIHTFDQEGYRAYPTFSQLI